MKNMHEKVSPFLHDSETTINLQLDLLIGLLAVTIISVIQNGLRVLAIVVLTAFVTWATETVCNIILRRSNANFIRSISNGFIIALLCPVTVSVWVPVISAFITVLFVQLVLGKTYKRLFITTALAWMVMLSIAPKQMTVYTAIRGFNEFPVFDNIEYFLPTSSIAQSLQSNNTPSYSVAELLTGHYPGGMGTTCIFIILAVCVYFIFRKSMAWQVSLSMILTVTAFALVFNRTSSSVLYSALYELTATSFIFIAVFVAGDIINTPMLTVAKILYGILMGTVTMLCRYLGFGEHCVVISLLICNLFAELFDIASLRYQIKFVKWEMLK